MQSYSFLKEVFSSFDDDDVKAYRGRVRKGWHTPQSRMSARKGTLGSFASITTGNNIYSDRQEDGSNG